MLVSDLLHSCANERVAAAAVSSIGGDFALELCADAEGQGVGVGEHAASIVRRFARDASERDWRELVDAVRGTDAPVLSGLRWVLSRPRIGADMSRRQTQLAASLTAGAAMGRVGTLNR